MNRLRTSAGAKLAAFILCVLALTLCLVSAGPVVWLNNMGGDRQYMMDRLEEQILQDRIEPISGALLDNYINTAETVSTQIKQSMEVFLQGQSDGNLFFSIRGEDGRLLASSEKLGDYRAKYSQTVTLPQVTKVSKTYESAWERQKALDELWKTYDQVAYELYPEESWAEDWEDAAEGGAIERPAEGGYSLRATCLNDEAGETVTVNGFIRAELSPYGSVYRTIHRAATLYDLQPLYVTFLAAGGALGLLCLLFLLWSAGHEKGKDGIALNAFDRSGPLDILLPAAVCAFLIWFAAGWEAADWKFVPDVFPVTPYLLLCLTLGFALYVFLSAVRRGKARAPQKENLFFAKAGRVCARGGRAVGRWLERLLSRLPLFWAAALVFLVAALLEGLCIVGIADADGFAVFLWFLFKALEAAGVIWLVLALRKLQAGGKELAAGHLDYQISLEKLHGPFRVHGEHLNSIRAAIQSAVEEQMKSERMKTELITNVSHDIKTPLTSIVNYVDLLKKQEMPTKEAREYLEVLERQSARLKKLTEDLVEASKASTGNLTVDLQRTDVNVLLTQSAGEYEERLTAKGLTLLLDPAPSNPAIQADGRLLWRVFDNLLSNILKYAQPGTRVYLTSQAENQTVTILFRNISAQALNISAEELMERFVRGDASRSTEGSGLGLSIARSLTQIQGGTFDLDIDGDLFKAKLTFPQV